MSSNESGTISTRTRSTPRARRKVANHGVLVSWMLPDRISSPMIISAAFLVVGAVTVDEVDEARRVVGRTRRRSQVDDRTASAMSCPACVLWCVPVRVCLYSDAWVGERRIHRERPGESECSKLKNTFLSLARPFDLTTMMRSVLSTLLVCAAAWATIVTTARASTKKVLVLVDDLAAKQTHSTFLKQLAFGGYDVTLSLASSEDAFLQKVDEWQYDHLVVLGGEGKFGEGVAPAKLLEFFESGRNVYLAINPETSGKARALAKRLGADVEAKRSTVVDPFSSEGSSVKAVVDEAAVDRLLPGVVESGSDVVFVDGIGFSIAPEATMTVGALHATPTAYATTDGAMDGAKRPTKLGGYSLKLAALVQGRNNARWVFLFQFRRSLARPPSQFSLTPVVLLLFLRLLLQGGRRGVHSHAVRRGAGPRGAQGQRGVHEGLAVVGVRGAGRPHVVGDQAQARRQRSVESF